MRNFVNKIKNTLTSGEQQPKAAVSASDVSPEGLRREVQEMFDTGLLEADDFDQTESEILNDVEEAVTRYQNEVLPIVEKKPNTLSPTLQNSNVEESEEVSEEEIQEELSNWLDEYVEDSMIGSLIELNTSLNPLFAQLHVEETTYGEEFEKEVEIVADVDTDDMSLIISELRSEYPIFRFLMVQKGMLNDDIPDERFQSVDPSFAD